MKESVFPYVHGLVLLSLLGLIGCYSSVTVDSFDEKAIAIDWVDPPCAVPGSEAGYIEGSGFGAENVTVTVGGIEAEVLAATGMDASFVVPEELEPGTAIEVVVENPGGRLATIDWYVCEIECDPPDCDDDNECTTDTCDPSVEECVHTPVGDGVACDFGGLPGVCIAGLCEQDLCANADCDDGDPCTTDSCDPFDGTCSYVNTCGDGDPPELIDFDFNPKTVDVSSGPAEVRFDVAMTDFPAGVARLTVHFQSPSASGSLFCNQGDAPPGGNPSSGDIFDGVWSCIMTIPQLAETGIWEIASLRLVDSLNNEVFYSASELAALGFPNSFTVTSSGGGDGDPPELIDFDFNPKTVDVSSGPAEVRFDVAMTDFPAGVARLTVHFQSPSASGSLFCNQGDAPPGGNPSSGDIFDGVWSCIMTIPQLAETGIWEIASLRLVDSLNNEVFYSASELAALGFPNSFTVTSSGGGDGDPPELIDFDFNPKTVDVSSGPAEVRFDVAMTDFPAGVARLTVHFQSPSASGSLFCNQGDAPPGGNPSSGDIFDGVWSCIMTIPQLAETGIWEIASLRLVDSLNNEVFYSASELAALGFPNSFTVTSSGGGDGDPPVLTGFELTPTSVDVSQQSQEVTCNMSVTDVGQGTQIAYCWVSDPSGDVIGCSASLPVNPVSGDAFDGTWACNHTIPQGAEAGTWTVHRILLRDAVNNERDYRIGDLESLGFPTQFEVISADPDADPPVLTGFELTPTSVDVSQQSQEVTCNMSVTDVGQGTQIAYCWVSDPSGDVIGCSASLPVNPVSGDAFDGTWACNHTIPQGAEAGTWTVHRILLRDAVNNERDYRIGDLESLGFPTQFEVISADPDADPPVLTGFELTPTSVDVSQQSQEVTCNMSVTDVGQGTQIAYCWVSDPSGDVIGCSASLPVNPVSGDAFDGTWACNHTIPQGAEAGTWTVHRILLRDAVNNERDYRIGDLESLGFPTQFEVTYVP